MENLTTQHMSTVKRTLRYVNGILNLGLVYEKNEVDIKLVRYRDSDYVGDLDDKKNTRGMAFFLGKQCEMLDLSKAKDHGLIIM